MPETVKMKNSQILEANAALAALMRPKRPMMGALKMRALARAIKAHLEDFEAERQKLLELHGDHDEDGKLKTDENSQVVFALDDPAAEPSADGVRKDGKARAAFGKDFGELLACEWECSTVLTVKDFGVEKGNCPHCRKELPEKPVDIEADLLTALGDLFDPDEDKKE